MPAARLLALAPPPPPLQLLRSASSAGGGGMASDRSRKGLPSTTRSVVPLSWCRCASSRAAASASTPLGHDVHNRTRRPAAVASTSGCARRTRQQQQRQQTAWFGIATLPKQVAFPRHGKAVEPQPVPDEKDLAAPAAATAATAAAVPDAPIQVQEAPQAAPASAEARGLREQRATKKKSQRAKANMAPSTSADDTGPSPSAAMPAKPEEAINTSAFGPEAGDDAAAAAIAAAVTPVEPPVQDTATVIALGAPPPPETTTGATEQPTEGQEQGPGQGKSPGSVAGGNMLSPMLGQPLAPKPPTPPHMAPPLYVHHFDSYSLVRQLEQGGYTRAQAITAMKAVRSLLAQNLDVAQANLVSKSDVENEAYLFKAACAELSIEVRNNRRRTDEHVRQQRTLLQHEVDIAGQTVNQELVTLADVIKGLFNDRKMAVREEQKAMESLIQQLNYKITIMLNSEMRSEIEGLRWVLIQRSALGIIFMAILTLGTLRYASYLSHEKQKEAERIALEAREAEAHRFPDQSAPPDAAEILSAS